MNKLFISIIVACCVVEGIRFYWGSRKLIKVLTHLTSCVSKYGDRIEQGVIGELDVEFKQTSLSGIWSEFYDSLVRNQKDVEGLQDRLFIYKTREASEYFNEDRVLSQYLMMRYWRGLPSILVGLGILGTFVGLSIGLAGLKLPDSSVGPEQAAQEIQAGISSLLSGVSTAFITSICGMVGSIIFSIFEKFRFNILRKEIFSLQIQLDKLFRLKAEQQLAMDTHDSIEQQTQALKSFSTDLSDSIRLSMQNVMGERLDTINQQSSEANQTHKSVAGQLEKMGEEANESTALISTQIDKVPEVIGQRLEQVISQEMTPALNDLKEALNQSLDKVTKAIEQLNQEKQTSSVDAIGQLVEAFQEKLGGETQIQLDSLQGAVSTVSETLLGLPSQFNDIIASLKSEVSEIQQEMADANQAAREESNRQRGEVEQAYAGLMAELRSAISDQQKSLTDSTAEANNSMLELIKQVNQIVVNITNGVENSMTEQTNLIKGVFADAAGEAAAATDIMKEQVEEVGSQFKDILGDVRDNVAGLLQQQESQAEFIDDLIGDSKGILVEGQGLAEKMTHQAAMARDMFSNIEKLSEKLTQSTLALETSSRSLSVASTDFTEQNKAYNQTSLETTQLLKEGLEKTEANTTQLAQQFALINQDLNGIFEQVQGGLTEYANGTKVAIDDYLGKFSSHLKDSASALSDSALTLSGTISELEGVAEQAERVLRSLRK